MSAQVCPVCGGKGLVPKGFYDVSSNLSTTSATPETCRSCQGKGYIIVTPSPNHFIANTFYEGCSNCVNNDGNLSGYMVTSDSGVYGCIKYRCILDQKLYSSKHVCDNYKRNQNSDK